MHALNSKGKSPHAGNEDGDLAKIAGKLASRQGVSSPHGHAKVKPGLLPSSAEKNCWPVRKAST